MEILPRARKTNLIFENFENELLIYDQVTHKAFCLNETSKLVYDACDGRTTIDELRNNSGLTDELIFHALSQLEKEKLLMDAVSADAPKSGWSRRDVIKRAGLAAVVAAPLITSLVAPYAADAQSVTAFCGNNIVEVPVETCDDGNTVNGDGCSSACQIEVP